MKQEVPVLIDKFPECGLHSLAIAKQFVGLLSFFEPPNGSVETICKALNFGEM
ncbi:putative P-type H(+)-exporting transporter [Helianthus anomalus]